MTTVEKFNINRIRNEVKDLSAEEQIKELRRYKSDFLRLPTLSRVQLFETPFDQQADIEIERLGHEVSDTPNVFKVSSKSGAKSDLLQIFYSLHKLHLIEKKTGGHPNQKEFLEAFGRFLGEDWAEKSTSPLISQRKNDNDTAKQDSIFNDLKAKWHGQKTT